MKDVIMCKLLKSIPCRLFCWAPVRRLCGVIRRSEADAVVTAAKAASEPEPHVDDLELLRGEWQIVACDRDGAEFAKEIGGRMKFDGDVATTISPDGASSAFRLVLNSSVTPKTIDWKLTQGEVTQTLHGLYQLDGDILRTCSPANFETERPTEIRTVSGDGRWVFELKRISQADPNE